MALTPSEPLDGQDDETEVRVTPAPASRPGDTLATPVADLVVAKDPDVPPGSILGEYTIGEKIGEGGMGMVFSATHPLIGKRAAVKVLRRVLCENPVTLERFVDEARVVNEIGHPNIVDVFAFGTLPDGRSYFVMEWLKGESLRARLAHGRLDFAEACGVMITLAKALEAAHDKGVIHRDLKPDNVFLVAERDGVPRVKLLDFGIAKLVREDKQVARTATGAMVGTPQYVAPEQAKGHTIDQRVDTYSLGCIAYELFAGRTPFVADNAMEMVAKHLMETPPRPRKLDGTIPPELDALVFEMVAKDSAARPEIAEVINVVERVAKRVRHGTDSGVTSTRAYGLPWRHRPLAIVLALGGAFAMAVVAFVIVKALAPGERVEPPPPPVTATPVPVAPASAPAPAPPASSRPEIQIPKPPPPPPRTDTHKPKTVKPAAPPARPRTVEPRPAARPTPDDDRELLEPGAVRR